MKTYLLIVLFAFVGFASKAQIVRSDLLDSSNLRVMQMSQEQNDRSDLVKPGEQMPQFTIVSDDGSKIQSSAFKGKVVLVNFFATWCPPCQKELAAVKQSLWPKYKNNKNFVLLVIGREHNDAELKKYNEKKGFEFPLYPDKNRAIYSAFATSLIPRSYLVDKSGKIIHVGKGFKDEEFADQMKQIDRALK